MKVWLTSLLLLVVFLVGSSHQDVTSIPDAEAEDPTDTDSEPPDSPDSETADTETESEGEPSNSEPEDTTTQKPSNSADSCQLVSIATLLSIALLNRVIA